MNLFAKSTNVEIVTVISQFYRRLRKAASPSVETYLKALVGFLTRSNVLACVGDDDNGDLVVVTSEELLCSANNVSDHDRGAEREDDMLVVRMQNQSLVDLACKEKVS